MNKATVIISTFFILLTACRGDAATDRTRPALADSIALHQQQAAPAGTSTPAEAPRGPMSAADALKAAYPDFIKDVADNQVVFTDGTTMTWDDRLDKTFEQRLDNSDVEDMFYVRYDDKTTPPEYLADPGRSRSEALFKKMYGSSAAQVQRNLVNVNWMGKNLKFTNINGAADSLRKVAAELERRPHLKKYLPCSGTFYWRNVRGANRLSAHSYGIAIDIAVPNSDYWLWRNPRAGETTRIKYANRIPAEIVEVFRRYGFIWGGAWYHYDTMHFEFRPEIINYSK